MRKKANLTFRIIRVLINVIDPKSDLIYSNSQWPTSSCCSSRGPSNGIMSSFLVFPWDYLLTGMDEYPKASTFRISIYFLEGVLIGFFFYLWLEYTQTGEIFKTYYPIFVAFTIIFWHYLATEFGGRYIYKRRKSFKVTIGKFWVISFAGACFGYIMIYFNGQCPGIAKYYPDISSFYSSHSSPTLVRLAVFYKIVQIPWAVSTFLLTQGELKNQIANELASIKHIKKEGQAYQLFIEGNDYFLPASRHRPRPFYLS